MKVNRVVSVDYSNININKDRSLGRVLATPSFGDITSLTEQAVVDQFISNANSEKQDHNNMARSNPISALGGKFSDLFSMFTPKSREKAQQLKSAIDEYVANPSSNIVYRF